MVSPELIIMKRWTWKQFTLLAFSVFSLLVLFALGGYFVGAGDAISFYAKNKQLVTNVTQLTVEMDDVHRQLLMQKQISKVDKAANLHVGNSMGIQLQQIRELERELKFFRSIMAPEETKKGLQISRFNWKHIGKRTFSWQLSLIQAGYQGRALSGVVKANIVAERSGEQVLLPLFDDDKRENFNYRFKYFQHFSGTISIADGLTPIAINIIANPTGEAEPLKEKQFPWHPYEETFANVE